MELLTTRAGSSPITPGSRKKPTQWSGGRGARLGECRRKAPYLYLTSFLPELRRPADADTKQMERSRFELLGDFFTASP